ncbi:MAG: DUF354 domain-containing protein [Candidatus Heimdallarchaeota archaeon]|nr:DUF354 domain-containing protein [Candidatus Heimdallarchaeota archaeon]
MKIWLEALTGKQAMLFHHLGLKLEALGHEIIITSRPYGIDRSNGNFDRYGRKHLSIGLYGGASLKDKLVRGAERVAELAELIDKEKPDLLIAFPSPDAFRTAFGLGIPSIQINDTPHAHAVGRLTISLSSALVHSEAVKSDEFASMGVSTFYPYKGVDEVLWIRDFQPNEQVLEELNITKNNYIVVRCEESKAAYFQKMYPTIKPGSTIVIEIINQLKQRGMELDIVAFPRYTEQEEEMKKLDVIIPDNSVDTLSLFYYAKAAMTAGGTMGREAALLGTPTLYSFPLELAVSTYIIDQGFPLLHVPNHIDVPEQIIKLISAPRMSENLRENLLSEMETPFEGVIRALDNM